MALEDYRGDMEMCCRCSTCKFIPMQQIAGDQYVNVCPSIARYNFHSYSGGGRLNIALSMLKGSIKYTDRLLDIVYNCQLCGACGVSCNYAMDMEVIEPITEFRMKCIADGQTNPSLEKSFVRLNTTGSMIPQAGQRGEWAIDLHLRDANREKVDVLFHAGCLTSANKGMHKLAADTIRIIQNSGVDIGSFGDSELCCGGRVYQMGYRKAFIDQAQKFMAQVEKADIKTLVTGCAHCYQAFKVLYDRFHLRGGLQVLHTTEYLTQLIQDGTIKPNKQIYLNVTYHDPCRLGRLGEAWVHWEGKKIPGHRFMFDPPKTYRKGTFGVYEAPRHILTSIPGIKLTEMVRIKEYAWCCGAGGGVLESNPEFAAWTARERIDEARSTGAEALVTSCPWCEMTFKQELTRSKLDFKVYDVIEILASAL